VKIGLTYDLRDDHRALGRSEEEIAEFDRADTIDAIAAAIAACGHEVDRIGHVQALTKRLARGDRWDLVFNIAEGLEGFGRESQVPALLEAHGVPCTFSDPLTCALTLHKGMAKHVLRGLGLPTPDFAVVGSRADAEAVSLRYPLFVKPVAEGTSKGIGPDALVRDRAALLAACERLLARFDQPVLVESYLPGREVTVSILGTGERARVLGVLEVVLRDTAEATFQTLLNKEECETRIEYRLSDAATAAATSPLALAAWRGLGCRDGGRVDLRQDAAGRWSVLEANPLPGMHPEHSDLPITATLAGLPYQELVRAIVDSACERLPDRAATCGGGCACAS